jgi:hypothetical protein
LLRFLDRQFTTVVVRVKRGSASGGSLVDLTAAVIAARNLLIGSISLYPLDGMSIASRQAGPRYAPVGEPWPQLTIGQQITILDERAAITRRRQTCGDIAARPAPQGAGAAR